MEVLIIKIKNNTDEVQPIDLNKFSFGIECETEVKEMSMSFDVLKIVTSSGGKVDSCFYNKSMVINEIEIYVPEWFSMSQHTNDYVNIKFLVDSFDSMKFEINPRKRIEIYLPIEKCNLEFYKNLKTQIK
jgi:hypothetical protein